MDDDPIMSIGSSMVTKCSSNTEEEEDVDGHDIPANSNKYFVSGRNDFKSCIGIEMIGR